MSEASNSNVHVTTHDGDKGDDSGVAAIIRAFLRNPAGAMQIIAFIGGMYGVYYAIQGEIGEVRADSVKRYTEFTNALERTNVKIEAISVAATGQATKLESLLSRGDARYANIIAKLSSHDVDIARIVANVDFIAEQYRNGGEPPANKARTILPPRVPVPLDPLPVAP